MKRQHTEHVHRDDTKPAESAPNTCIVCGRDSGGKAICSDPRCAEELAQG